MIQSLAGLKRRYIHPLLNNNNEILHSVIIYFTKKVKLCVKTHVDPFNILQNYNDQQYVKVTVVSITLSVFYICSHLCPDQQAYRHVPIKFEWANRWRPYNRKTRDRQTTVPSILAYNNIHFLQCCCSSLRLVVIHLCIALLSFYHGIAGGLGQDQHFDWITESL